MSHPNRLWTPHRTGALLAFAVLGLAAAAWWVLGSDRLDRGIQRLMTVERLPAGVVAVGRAGSAPEVRTYGLARPKGHARRSSWAVEPDTRFRIASLSKPVVAAAVLALVEEGRLDLDARLGRLLPDLVPDWGSLREVTVADLLRHSGGWDRATTFDPFFLDTAELEHYLGLRWYGGRDCRPVAEAMVRRGLQFAPGTRYAYSNLGYCWLGLVLEQVTGWPWDAAVRAMVPEAADFRLDLGFADAWPQRIAGTAGFLLHRPEMLGPAGGFNATAAALFRFAERPVPAAVRAVPPYVRPEAESYYGLGWRVWRGARAGLLTHYGAMPGSFALLARHDDGRIAVALFNARPSDDLAAVEHLLTLFGF